MDVKNILQEYKSYTPKAHGGSISSLNMADLCHRKRLYTEAMEGESFRNTEKGSQYYRVMIVNSTIKYALIYGLTGQNRNFQSVVTLMHICTTEKNAMKVGMRKGGNENDTA